jgi:iron complex transport system permease protein
MGIVLTPTGSAVTSVTADPPPPQRRSPHRGFILLLGLVVLALGILAAVAIGSTSVSLGEVSKAIALSITGGTIEPSFAKTYAVVVGLRLPRVVLAALAGAGLSLAGALMQALLRNPLVSPFTLGVSPAAAFGAAFTILLFQHGGAPDALVAGGAFVTALAVSTVVLGLSRNRTASTATLLLLGVAMTQLFEAGTSALQFVADENTLQQIVHWTFGSVNDATWTDVAMVGTVLLIALPLSAWNSTKLNAVAFAGDDAAKSLGVNVEALRIGLIVVSVVLASVVVSTCGVIGFVGLVGPHIARLIIGADHRFLVPFSAITGGLLLMFADTVGRTVLAPAVVPVGIVVAIIGAPLFINLILTRKGALG